MCVFIILRKRYATTYSQIAKLVNIIGNEATRFRARV
jgi:hypothetical protein